MSNFQEWRAGRKADHDFRVAVQQIDASSLSTAPLTGDRRVRDYATSLQHIDTLARSVADDPQAVFNGEFRYPKEALRREDERTHRPPRFTYSARLAERMETPDPKATAAQITNIVAERCNVPKEQRPTLVAEILQLLNHDHLMEVDLNSAWRLRIGIERAKRETRLYPALIPLEQPHFSTDWEERHIQTMQDAIRPEHVSQALLGEAQKNFRVTRASLLEADSLDVGGLPRVQETVTTAGYQRIEDGDTVALARELSMDPLSVYRHAGGPPPQENSPLLGIEARRLSSRYDEGQEIGLFAVASRQLQEANRREFQARFRQGVKDTMTRQKEEAKMTGKDTVNLSPGALTVATIRIINHQLSEYDFHQEVPSLSRIALEVVVDELRHLPGCETLVQRFEDAERVSHAGEIPLGATVDIGFRPERVQLTLPTALLKQ